MSQLTYADLDQGKLNQLQGLESELDAWLVAVAPEAADDRITEEEMMKLKRMDREQLVKLQTAENELGVILLAYNRQNA